MLRILSSLTVNTRKINIPVRSQTFWKEMSSHVIRGGGEKNLLNGNADFCLASFFLTNWREYSVPPSIFQFRHMNDSVSEQTALRQNWAELFMPQLENDQSDLL